MLLLSRKKYESLTLRIPEGLPAGTVITVTVLDVDRGKVRLGLEAPREVLILRKELEDPRE